MIVCILSDSHDRIDRMLAAAQSALDEGAEAFLHCGDLIATETLTELKRLGKPIYLVHGNNSGNLDELRTMRPAPTAVSATTAPKPISYSRDAASFSRTIRIGRNEWRSRAAMTYSVVGTATPARSLRSSTSKGLPCS